MKGGLFVLIILKPESGIPFFLIDQLTFMSVSVLRNES